jgi:2-polyprenyl-3-methyl-5-hydroxy-6-metoxy-1,4-benzoquinol methylase
MSVAEPRRRLYDAWYDPDRPLEGLSPSVRAYYDQHFGPHLPGDRDANILDVGCGSGRFVLYLRGRGYTNVSGVDASPGQVAVAHRLGLRTVALGTAAEHLDGRAGALDLVLAVDVLEHLDRGELLQVLDAARRSLRPGGRLVVQVPNGAGPFAGRLRYGDLTHERAFTAGSIAQALAACGFSRVTVHPVRPAVHGPASAIRWALWHLMRLGYAACLAVETGVVRGHVLSHNLIAVAEP